MTGPRKATAALAVWTAFLLGCGSNPTRKVEIVEPADTGYADEAITLRAVVTGELPATMTFRVDGTPLANVAPPYEFVWNTRALPEGGHKIDAQGRYSDDTTVTSIQRMVIVDHQPLTIASRSPAPDAGTLNTVEAVLTASRDFLPDAGVVSAHFLARLDDRPATVRVDGRRLVASTTDTLPPGDVTVLWTGAIVDRVGHRLDLSQESWKFRIPVGFEQIDSFDGFTSSLAAGSKLVVDDESVLRVLDPAGASSSIGPVAGGLTVRAGPSGVVYAAAASLGDTISIKRLDPGFTQLLAETSVLQRPEDSQQTTWAPGLAVDADGGFAVAWQRHGADGGFQYDVARWNDGDWEMLAPRQGNFQSIELLNGDVVTLGPEGLGIWLPSVPGWMSLLAPTGFISALTRDPAGRLAALTLTSDGLTVEHPAAPAWVADSPPLLHGTPLYGKLAFAPSGEAVVACQVPDGFEVWRNESSGWSAVGAVNHLINDQLPPGLPYDVELTVLADGRVVATVTSIDSSDTPHTAVFLEIR